MKIQGKKVQGRNKEIIAIPRPDGPVIFVAEAVISFAVFEKLVPEPKPPARKLPNGTLTYDYEDKGFKLTQELYHKKRNAWLILESLKSTPDLEWETVDYGNPDTWLNWEQELKDSDFNIFEIQRIQIGVYGANCLNESLVQSARDSFVRGTPAEATESSGLSTAP